MSAFGRHCLAIVHEFGLQVESSTSFQRMSCFRSSGRRTRLQQRRKISFVSTTTTTTTQHQPCRCLSSLSLCKVRWDQVDGLQRLMPWRGCWRCSCRWRAMVQSNSFSHIPFLLFSSLRLVNPYHAALSRICQSRNDAAEAWRYPPPSSFLIFSTLISSSKERKHFYIMALHPWWFILEWRRNRHPQAGLIWSISFRHVTVEGEDETRRQIWNHQMHWSRHYLEILGWNQYEGCEHLNVSWSWASPSPMTGSNFAECIELVTFNKYPITSCLSTQYIVFIDFPVLMSWMIQNPDLDLWPCRREQYPFHG